MEDHIREFLGLADLVQSTVDSDASWESKYNLIFSDECSRVIFANGPLPDYYDPDMNYEDDVRAFAEAVKRKADEYRKALGFGQNEEGLFARRVQMPTPQTEQAVLDIQASLTRLGGDPREHGLILGAVSLLSAYIWARHNEVEAEAKARKDGLTATLTIDPDCLCEEHGVLLCLECSEW